MSVGANLQMAVPRGFITELMARSVGIEADLRACTLACVEGGKRFIKDVHQDLEFAV